MFEFFAYDFMQRAFLVGLIVSVVAPTIGFFFVVRRFGMIADTLAHVSLAGVAAGLVFNVATIPAAFVASILAVFGMERMREKKILPADTLVALFLFGGLALGVVLLGLARGRDAHIMNFLFGNILTVTRVDVFSIGVIGALAFFLTILFWRPLFALCVDEDIAEASGLPVRTLNRLLAALGAATIAISLNVVGVLLIGALMVIPVLAAMSFQRGFQTTWMIALFVSMLSVIGGLIASFVFDLASGGTIVLCSVILFLLSRLFSPLFV